MICMCTCGGSDVHFMLHVGMLGFITEVTLRIRPLPEVRRYGSVVFHSFELGVQFMREVARQVIGGKSRH